MEEFITKKAVKTVSADVMHTLKCSSFLIYFLHNTFFQRNPYETMQHGPGKERLSRSHAW